MFEDFKIRNINFRLLIYVVALSVVGVLVIRSATASQGPDMTNKQMLGIGMGLVVLAIVAIIPYQFILKFFWLIYGVVIALLFSVKLFGVEVNRAKRWIILPVIGQFQPSEVAKIGLIAFFAMFLYLVRDRISKFSTLIVTAVLLAIPLGLILTQPNLSTSLVVVFITLCLIFTAGISYKWILGALAVVVPSFSILIYMISKGKPTFLKPYQEVRIMSWIDPEKYADSYYQQKNSIMAIGSGQLWGKGLNNVAVDSVKNGNYLAEVQTDFIFAVVGEELGFVGSMVVVGLLALILFECMLIAGRTKELRGRLICVGMAALIGFQSFVNIAVATGILPNTGLPLPFVSYGVTSLVSMYIGIGLVLNVGIYGKHK